MRLVMMGTGPFAVPTFRWLLDSSHVVAALVTRPTPLARGRRKMPANPMRDVALERNVDVLQPRDVNSLQAQADLTSLEAELLVVCDFGQILSAHALGTAKLGGANLHASLLPKYRGAAPINWALYHGETETGVTVIQMSPKLDAGASLVQLATAIDSRETAAELEPRLAVLGVEAVTQAIDLLARWDGESVLGVAQDPAQATRAPRLTKTDGLVDWTRSAEQLANQVRAMKPWPGTYTFWRHDGTEPTRLILDRVAVANSSCEQTVPGSVVEADRDKLHVATGSGVLSLRRVQPAGKKAMEITEFLRGYRLGKGDLLGSEEA